MKSPSRTPVMHPLIASNRIEGTMVCRIDGTQLGTIERLMINKISGQVAYAVVKSVEKSGIRKVRFPLRWDSLHYDRRRGAYVVDLSEEEIRRVPAGDGGFDWGDRNDVSHIRPYRPPSFWGSSS
jgi:PRC-barrel domain